MIRKTEEADREEVLAVYNDAKEYFRTHGIPQWQKGTPDGNTLHSDMQRGYSYVLEKDGKIVGTACIIEEADPDYLSITEGRWLNEEPYVVIHRIAVLSSCKGKGLASELLACACEKARAKGWNNIRIDTHEDNRSMRRLLAKNGFVQCGNVRVGKYKEPRIAYQKVL